MRTQAFYNGQNFGWDLAGLFLEGGKAGRRQARRYLDRTRDVTNPFVEGVREAFLDRTEQRLEAIRQGTTRRTIRPSLITYVANRISF
jgi:hypothetical protein